MLLRRGHVTSAVQGARLLNDEQVRRTILLRVAQELINRREAEAAKAINAELYEDAQATRDDSTRSFLLGVIADLESQLGLFRQSRLICQNCLSIDKLSNSIRLLWRYEARRNAQVSRMVRDHDSRYTIGWFYYPMSYEI